MSTNSHGAGSTHCKTNKRPADDDDITATSNSEANKRSRITTNSTNPNTAMSPSTTTTSQPSWGDWMGSWKIHTDQIDQEAERIDRQKAAFGGDTISRLKDLNVLMIGCQGVGVETAKNLILTNVGGVLVWDPTICRAAHRGTNFYVTDEHVASSNDISLAAASIDELKTLNPFCRVDVHTDTTIGDAFLTSANILSTNRPLAAVVVTRLDVLPNGAADLYRINETCRQHGIAFLMALNHGGVTASLFSDFGPSHEIADATGEPTQTLAISNVETVPSKPKLLEINGVAEGAPVVLVTVAQTEHGLDDNDVVVFDDMRGALEKYNGKQLQVKRVAIASPVRGMLIAAVFVGKKTNGPKANSIPEIFFLELLFILGCCRRPATMHVFIFIYFFE